MISLKKLLLFFIIKCHTLLLVLDGNGVFWFFSHLQNENNDRLRKKKEMFLFNNTLITFYLCYRMLHMCLMTTEIMRGNPLVRFLTCSFWLAAWNILYAQSHRQDSTYHGLGYISCIALTGTRNSFMSPPTGINPMTHATSSRWSVIELCPAPIRGYSSTFQQRSFPVQKYA